MQKHKWQKVTLQKTTKQPSPRWGHSSLLLGQEIVCFGGYADSNYMNDVWSFHTHSMTWTEHHTTGQIPTPRSNCTIHYDEVHRRIIVFGGGGFNKKRFNTLNLLDWETKEWTQVVPKPNEPAPWERSYHSSGIIYPYLIVFGGQGVSDLGDLWLYNLETNIWSEVATDKSKPKPCERRFHSSVVIGTTFYVIGGCYAKYRCLGDVFSMDLSPALQTGQTNQLEWNQLKIKESSFLTRWGHTSTVFDEKIYIFGGRFSNDLQDILIIDPLKSSLKTMKITGECPKARRRHSTVLLGSCLLIFGGFNGDYFNDLHYISLFELKHKLQANGRSRDEILDSWVNSKTMSDYQLTTIEGVTVHLHQGLIADRFESAEDMKSFLSQLQNKASLQTLLEIMLTLYTGVGRLDASFEQHYHLNLHQTAFDRDFALRKSISCNSTQKFSLTRIKTVITLEPQQYQQYLDECDNTKYHDVVLVLNQQYCLPANRALLAVNSQYFACLFANCPDPQICLTLDRSMVDVRVFQVLLNYLQNDLLVLPAGLDEHCWMFLYQLAEYFCLQRLTAVCEMELITKLTHTNCEHILDYSLVHNLPVLSLHSAEHLFRCLLETGNQEYLQSLKEKILINNKERLLSKILELLRFDLLQIELRKETSTQITGKVQHGQQNCQKENENVIE